LAGVLEGQQGMVIRILSGDIHLTELQTRMPFRYGIATMTRTPHAFVRLQVEVDGRVVAGIAADSLPPKWFTKDPSRPLGEEIDEMLLVIENALRLSIGMRGSSTYEIWRHLFDEQAVWGRRECLPPLLTNFGTSLIERALIEAVCIAVQTSFALLVHSPHLGRAHFDLPDRLRTRDPGDLLPRQPLTSVLVRHTIGLADPITEADIAPADRVHDGLPQSLQACIQAYGLRHFKIKVSGQLDSDRDRVARIASAVESCAAADYAFSLDGNEQFNALHEFRTFWESLLSTPSLSTFWRRLLFVEQPFHRSVALDPEVLGGLADWHARPTLIIDESDAELDSLPRALELGYAGTSHKNCKGVYKSIANACLLAERRQQRPSRPAILSGEDLVNIGPVALLQDLAVAATLGIGSIERNGHHYFTGLSMFAPGLQRQILDTHSDLYHASPTGWPTLTIRDGIINLDSVLRAPLGLGFRLDVGQFTPLEAWKQSRAIPQPHSSAS
jgi:hypothetical protein